MGKSRQKKSSRSSTTTRHTYHEIGYTVDLADLLFTPERDFLVKNNGHKVRIDDLKDKTIVLFVVPLLQIHLRPGDNLDMVQAYNELSPLGGVESVFVPVYIPHCNEGRSLKFASKEAIFNRLFTTLPWPAVPFSDVEASGDRVVKTFSVDHPGLSRLGLPYWAVIDPTGTVVATRGKYSYLFKIFGGAELYPLSRQRICALWDEYDNYGQCNEPRHRYRYRCESRKRLINNWDQLLASPTRDFLLSSNGDQVPISSLKGKVIGLYFCDNSTYPPNMKVIKEVYGAAKSRGYDFEIVQINFHYLYFNKHHFTRDMSAQLCCEKVDWLTLPFGDPSCRKIQRILEGEYDDECYEWLGDCLVIVDECHIDSKGIVYEFSAVEIFYEYGIEGYPFTRQSLFEKEYRTLKKETKLQSFFPPGLCHLIRPRGDGFDSTDASLLTEKSVLVLFSECKSCPFVSFLKSKYRQHLNDGIEGGEFEVVYVPTCNDSDSSDSDASINEAFIESVFSESTVMVYIKDMPWLVHPYSMGFGEWCTEKIFKYSGMGTKVAAFDVNGELMAKECYLDKWQIDDLDHKLPFPFFVSQDLEGSVREYVEGRCLLDKCHIADCS